jgi:hypothetical protein
VATPSSDCLTAAVHERLQLADLRRPALGIARLEAPNQCAVLNVSKVASNSSDGGPGIGQQPVLATVGFVAAQRWL